MSRSSRRLRYLSTSRRICQALFTSFFKFFCAVRCAPGSCRSSHNFYMLSQMFPFVKNFFRFFSNFFLFLPPLLRQLGYSSIQALNCQALFYKFRTYFLYSVMLAKTAPELPPGLSLYIILYCIDQNSHFLAMYSFSSLIGIRTCSMVSRSRTVTQLSASTSPSPTVWKSTVMHRGVPISSSRR